MKSNKKLSSHAIMITPANKQKTKLKENPRKILGKDIKNTKKFFFKNFHTTRKKFLLFFRFILISPTIIELKYLIENKIPSNYAFFRLIKKLVLI